jgi:hypothetical protein
VFVNFCECKYIQAAGRTQIKGDIGFSSLNPKAASSQQRADSESPSQVKLLLPELRRADSALRLQAVGGVGVCASVVPMAIRGEDPLRMKTCMLFQNGHGFEG